MKYPVLDGHCDTAVELWRKGESLAKNSGQISLAQAAEFPAYVQFFAFCTVWIKNAQTDEERFASAMAYFSEQLREHNIPLCRTSADVSAILQNGGVGAALSIEGAEAFDCDPGRLEELAAQGVRMIAPVWNAENALAGSCMTGGGLTAQGREFVRVSEIPRDQGERVHRGPGAERPGTARAQGEAEAGDAEQQGRREKAARGGARGGKAGGRGGGV